MKGIVLAGGRGTRLGPLTDVLGKQLLPVYDKPMVYYPLSVLMLAGLREILLISTAEHLPLLRGMFGTGAQLGLQLEYATQDRPGGIAEALLIGADFLGGESCALILGDNLYYGAGLPERLRAERAAIDGGVGPRGTVFATRVKDPARFGVVELHADGEPLSIEEKPARPRSRLAVTGLYLYTASAAALAAELAPSARGELEITDLNRALLDRGALRVVQLGRGTAWMDMGSPEKLMEAAGFVRAIQSRQGLKVACLEEIAWRMGWITDSALAALAERRPNAEYGDYLRRLVRESPGTPSEP